MDFLAKILASTRQAVEERRSKRPLERRDLPERTADHVFMEALRGPGVAVIAEFKRDWPSAEEALPDDPDLEQVLGAYQRAGARAVSVLTEERRFRGSLEDLHAARAACSRPILRKDFIIDEYQVFEAVEAGVDAILLIAAAFREDQSAFRHLHDTARELCLDVLVEVRHEKECDRALEIGAELIGVNNRDLSTLKIDPRTTQRLMEHMPADVAVVSESGHRSAADIKRLRGVEAVLVGSALMEASDREAKCRELVEAGASHFTSAMGKPPTAVAA